MQTAFELKPRGNTHTATHLRNEFQQLLRMHKEDELHLFRPGRTNGYAAVNFFHRGYERLEESRMANFIEQSTAYADIMRDVLNPENISEASEDDIQQTLERMIAEANQEASEDSDSDDDTDSQVDDGDIHIHGMEYSDDDSDIESEDGTYLPLHAKQMKQIPMLTATLEARKCRRLRRRKWTKSLKL
ncbi:hypothetical protein B0H17DRAFT_1149619 [Mycena rosella]|uniref:Uncharacterized protein n=1 Tax=Mycena rosella TaxID=1033263 RepID=A0AAD7FT13_MYCRO|nr:hypothetical protein B0H17DRAFT_1149619 [Mycena rosella]